MNHQRIARTLQLSFVALVILLSHGSAIGVDAPALSGVVAFRMHEHLIVVQGSINGLKDLNFALDTGSTFTILSKEVGKKLGLKGEKINASAFGREIKMKKVFLRVLNLGQAKFEEVEARLCEMPEVRGLRLDGLIGLDLLRRATLTLDFEQEEAVFGGGREFASSARFYAGLSFIPVTMTVGGKALRLALDTAACGLVIYEEAVKGQFEVHRTNRVESRSQVGGRVKMEEIALTDVALADTLWEKLPAYLIDGRQSGTENVMGNLGVASLGLKAIQFDFETGRLGWER